MCYNSHHRFVSLIIAFLLLRLASLVASMNLRQSGAPPVSSRADQHTAAALISEDFSSVCLKTGCRLYDMLANFNQLHKLHGLAKGSWKEVQFNACCHYRVIRIVAAEDSFIIGVGYTIDGGLVDSTLTWNLNEFTKQNEFDDIFRNPVYLVARYEPNGLSSSATDSIDVSVQYPSKDLSIKFEPNTQGQPAERIFGPIPLDRSNGSLRFVVKQSESSARLFANSYLLFCAAQVDATGNPNHDVVCYPIFGHGTFVRCICGMSDSIQLRFLPVLVVCGLLWLIAFILGSKVRARMELSNVPETQYLLIMCQLKNFRYQYDIIFRAGCPSPSFDMNTTLIDIELLGADMAIIGTSIRFAAAKLPDLVCSEMRCEMLRLTPLDRIDAIRVYHSGDGPDQLIYLYDFFLRDCGLKQIVQAVHVNRHITPVPTVITIPPPSPIAALSSSPLSQPTKSIAFCEVSNPDVPVLPKQKLNQFECFIIFHLATLYAGAFLLALYLAPNSQKLRSILLVELVAHLLPFMWPADNLFGAFLVSIVAFIATIAFVYCLVYLYRNMIKWYYFKQKHTQGRYQTMWSKARAVSMVLAISCALWHTLYMLLRTNQLTSRQCWFWWASYFNCLLAMLTFWYFNPFLDEERRRPSQQ